jgi:hypothetical protein
MTIRRPRLTLRRCLIAVAVVAIVLSRTTLDLHGDIRGVTLHLGCSSIAGVWWNGLAGRYEAGYWPDVWTGRKPVGFGYDPKRRAWTGPPSPQ